MGDVTGISWTRYTYNPWQGCAKVSAGCEFCYMFRDKVRFGQDPEVVVRSKPHTFNRPMRWDRDAAAAGRKDLVFTCSWSDWFIREADEWRPEAWAMVKRTPNLIYQILTKRPSRIKANLPPDWGTGYENVWLGVSAENQEEADRRIPLLLAVDAKVHFVSIEPQLGLVSLDSTLGGTQWVGGSRGCTGKHHGIGSLTCPRALHHHHDERCRKGIDWAIYGGESGTPETSRPTDIEWIRQGVNECRLNNVAAFVKQMGSPWALAVGSKDDTGGDMAEWPEDVRVRQFPAGYVGSVTPVATDLVEL